MRPAQGSAFSLIQRRAGTQISESPKANRKVNLCRGALGDKSNARKQVGTNPHELLDSFDLAERRAAGGPWAKRT